MLIMPPKITEDSTTTRLVIGTICYPHVLLSFFFWFVFIIALRTTCYVFAYVGNNVAL